MPGFCPLNPLSPPVATALFPAIPLDDHILPLHSCFHYMAVHTLSVNVLTIRLHYRPVEHLSTVPETIVLTMIPRCGDIAGSLHFNFRVICSRLHPLGVGQVETPPANPAKTSRSLSNEKQFADL